MENNILEQLNKYRPLEKAIACLGFYDEPQILKEEYASKFDLSKLDKKKLKEYRILLTAINQAVKKVDRYEVYFEKFYSSDQEISDREALEHHIHSYLEDLTILKEKVRIFLSTLKNDLKKIASNKKEVEENFKIQINQILKGFEEVSKHRDPHHHNGPRFIDPNLIDSEMAANLLKPDNPLAESFKPEFLEELKKKEVESFSKAKKEWISLAQQNAGKTEGLVNEVIETNIPLLYQLLGVTVLEDLFE